MGRLLGPQGFAWFTGEGLKTRNRGTAAKETALMGLLFALAIGLSALEGLLPPLLPVPGVKPGLSNVVTMYCIFVLGRRKALLIVVLKALFSMLTRGFVAGVLSLSGGMLSAVAMLVLLAVFGGRASYALVSMTGAICHNLGQLAAAALLLRLGQVLWYYLPVLVAAGIGMGLLTSVVLRVTLPLLPGLHNGNGSE